MNHEITESQRQLYRKNGFIVIDDFLTDQELNTWRTAVDKAVKKRKNKALPDREEVMEGADRTFVDKSFDQLINLWQDSDDMKRLILDQRIGKMACDLTGCSGMRVWHDQALIKQPWGNPSTLHTDTPYWSFHHKEALSIWIALDDATLQNGCLFFLPGSHKLTDFKEAGFTQNMDEVFVKYPDLKHIEPVPAPMKAGSCSFHCGLTIHGANANMTAKPRRAMTCAFMPEGSTFNGNQNILNQDIYQTLKLGQELTLENQTPLIYSRN